MLYRLTEPAYGIKSLQQPYFISFFNAPQTSDFQYLQIFLKFFPFRFEELVVLWSDDSFGWKLCIFKWAWEQSQAGGKGVKYQQLKYNTVIW